MEHSTAERFLILIHHPEKSRYVVSEQMRNVGLIGAILLDLSFEDKIKIEDGKLMVSSTSTRLSEAHLQVLLKIRNSSKKKKIKSWIAGLAQHSGKYRREVLLDLGRKRLLTVEHHKFLFIRYIRTRLASGHFRDQMIREIREAILQVRQMEPDKAMILGLVDACNLYKIICPDREERKVCKAKLKEMIQEDLIAKNVGKVIKEMQAAVAIAVISSLASVTAAAAAHR